jgi:ring-1,2-phenylacetyl-CoA epoxidase subunit PaaC
VSAASRAELLLPIADDELVLGWRNSEWTGIAPFLEEDVAFSSIAQNEIGHARALYELVAEEVGTDADTLAFERQGLDFRSCPLVELRLVPDWARTIARHFLYKSADAVRVSLLEEHGDPAVSGLAAKLGPEEAYHRLHAQMWVDRLLASAEGRSRLEAALLELWPYALGVLDAELRPRYVEVVGEHLELELPDAEPIGREQHLDELGDLMREMTEVRRLVPAGRW